MRTLPLLLAAFVAATPAVLRAQDSTAAPKPKPAKPLFTATTPLTIKLTADFKATFKNRDTTKAKKEEFPATLSWIAEGDSGTLNVQIETRGHYRLKPGTCSFPGLRIRFPKDKIAGTIWKGQGTIKLGTHCKSSARYFQIPLQEYVVYRIYNALTDSSFRARLANATYVDTGDANKSVDAPAFFLEDDNDLAGRLGAETLKQKGARFEDLDEDPGAMLSIFEYMVGNTDWSLPFLHNIRLFRIGMGYAAIPYDFDWSGLVNAPYAFPDYRLGTKSVTERVWRGPCISKEGLDRMVTTFNGRKDAIYAAVKDQAGLDPKLVKDMTDYLDEFFKMLNDPNKAAGELRVKC